MSKIKCTVDQCVYNNCHYCDAGQIEVTCCGTTQAQCCDQTECRTFQKRG